jgi:hypothetical protein
LTHPTYLAYLGGHNTSINNLIFGEWPNQIGEALLLLVIADFSLKKFAIGNQKIGASFTFELIFLTPVS